MNEPTQDQIMEALRSINIVISPKGQAFITLKSTDYQLVETGFKDNYNYHKFRLITNGTSDTTG